MTEVPGRLVFNLGYSREKRNSLKPQVNYRQIAADMYVVFVASRLCRIHAESPMRNCKYSVNHL